MKRISNIVLTVILLLAIIIIYSAYNSFLPKPRIVENTDDKDTSGSIDNEGEDIKPEIIVPGTVGLKWTRFDADLQGKMSLERLIANPSDSDPIDMSYMENKTLELERNCFVYEASAGYFYPRNQGSDTNDGTILVYQNENYYYIKSCGVKDDTSITFTNLPYGLILDELKNGTRAVITIAEPVFDHSISRSTLISGKSNVAISSLRGGNNYNGPYVTYCYDDDKFPYTMTFTKFTPNAS